MKVKDLARIEVELPKIDTDDVIMTSHALFEKSTSRKSWITKVCKKLNDLVRIGMALTKFEPHLKNLLRYNIFYFFNWFQVYWVS